MVNKMIGKTVTSLLNVEWVHNKYYIIFDFDKNVEILKIPSISEIYNLDGK